MRVSHSAVSDSATLWTVAHRAPVRGILKAGILEWGAISSSRGSSPARDGTLVPALQADS